MVACAQDTTTPEGCWYEASTTSCGDPGTTCVELGGAATCACPTSNACTQLDETRCSAAGDQVLRCLPLVPGSACLAWQLATDCAADGLVCSGNACVCPANPGQIFVADAVGGSPGGAAPRPTGLLSPVACRYRTLTDALAAANARGAGSAVMAAGWSAAVPDGVVLFSEPGGLSIGAGVTLGTDDGAPTTDHYAITTAAALTGPLVAIGPGGTMTGFEIRNAASSGDGVRTACPAPADTLPVALSTIRIVAASSGTPAARLASGVGVWGHCGATLTDVIVDGAATGILVNSDAPGVESAATRTRVTGSTVAGVAVVEGTLTFSGGAVEANAAGVLVGTTGTGAPTFSATGTTFSGNSGDGIYVARGTLVTDACPYSNNGTHVHAQPAAGAGASVTVRNSSGAAKMTGATNSAFRLLAMGSASALVLVGNEVTENDATQSYNVSTGLRRGGGIVFTPPLPGSALIHASIFAGNLFDQVLVAASAGAVD
ncbi:MAG: Parallel beta-helix repeat protein, partial [Anaeromyxobacteraceae bacterium]|nr:Parallel beta-helix repeat protein [Anaeromyxobacteraceae bacterium]